MTGGQRRVGKRRVGKRDGVGNRDAASYYLAASPFRRSVLTFVGNQ